MRDAGTDPRPLRVLHVITRLIRGGAQMNTLDTVTCLSSPRFESWLASGSPERELPNLHQEAMNRGVRLILVPQLVREVSPWRDLRAFLHLHRILRSGRFDIVHTHTSKAGILGRAAAATVLPRPAIIHTPHGHVFYGYFGRTKTACFKGLERLAALVTDRMVVLTAQGRRDHEELRIMPAGRIEVIPSGVDLDRFRKAQGLDLRSKLRLPEEAFLVGSVGRLVEVKGHLHLIRAIAELERVHVILVGEGELKETLQQEAMQLGCEERLHFLGFSEEIPELLKSLDLFVLPSLNEGMGRALLEAMAAGLPCIATRVGGVVDLIEEGRTGMLVPAKNPEALSVAIRELMDHQEKRDSLGHRAKEWVDDSYGREHMVDRLAALYDQVVKEKETEWKGGPRWTSSSLDRDCW